MSFFSSIGHAFKHLGHDIEHAAKAVINGVEQTVRSIENDVKQVVQDALAMTEALMQGHLNTALNDVLKVGEDVRKTVTDVGTAPVGLTLEGLQGLNLGKGFDKAMTSAEKGLNSAKTAVENTVNQIDEQVVSAAEGVVTGSLRAVKDLAQGHIGQMMADLAQVGGDALDTATDLTPEGLAAEAVATTLSALHVGSAALDDAVAGALHGGVGQVVKAVAKTEASQTAESVVNSYLQKHPLPAAAGTALTVASLVPSGGGHQSAHHHAAPAGDHVSKKAKGSEPSAPKNEEAKGKQDNGESVDKNKNNKTQQDDSPPHTNSSLLADYLADSKQFA